MREILIVGLIGLSVVGFAQSKSKQTQTAGRKPVTVASKAKATTAPIDIEIKSGDLKPYDPADVERKEKLARERAANFDAEYGKQIFQKQEEIRLAEEKKQAQQRAELEEARRQEALEVERRKAAAAEAQAKAMQAMQSQMQMQRY